VPVLERNTDAFALIVKTVLNASEEMEAREHIPLAQRLAWLELRVGRNSVFKVHPDAHTQTGNPRVLCAGDEPGTIEEHSAAAFPNYILGRRPTILPQVHGSSTPPGILEIFTYWPD
jgi:hypothetical protein